MTTSTLQTETFKNPPEALPDPYLFRIRDLIYRASGIYQPDNKFFILEHRCNRRLEATGITSVCDYYRMVTTGASRDAEMRALLNEITVGETSFFRNQPQLDAFRSSVIPQLMEVKSRLGNRHLRVWSAGCATGEDPYTLAMILAEESLGVLRGWTYDIYAVDLNDHRLDQARQGVYGEYSLHNVTPYYLQKYFK